MDAILAGGFNKIVTLAGSESPNRVVILQFANMDALKAWRQEGEADIESNVGNEYAGFRVYAVEGVARWAALPAYLIAEFMSKPPEESSRALPHRAG
jgi:hypothetical protein